MSGRKSCHGFNLYEMLVVISIMAILLSIAVPLVTRQFVSYNIQQTILQLESVFKDAQEEALRRGVNVYVCAANYTVTNYLATNGCLGSTDWSEGALSFADFTNDTTYSSGERIQSLQFTRGVTVSGYSARFYFNSVGKIFDSSGDDSDSNWIFYFSQNKFGTNITMKVSMNNRGAFSSCTVGDSGC